MDEFGQALVGKALATRSVNVVLDLLAQIRDDVIEQGLLEANPARGKRLRLRMPRGSQSF